MADEIEMSGALAYEDAEGAAVTLSRMSQLATAATKKFVHAVQSVGLTEEAIHLGEVTSPGWAMFVNRDPTNYVELRTGTGGVYFAKIPPNKGCGPFHFGAGVTAPYAAANTAACLIEYLIVSQ